MQRAMERMGYTPAAARPGCQNCAHGTGTKPTGALNDRHPVRCGIGHFGTTPLAICNDHKPKDFP